MKRHPSLEELSRDHHHALVVAQRLRRASEPTGEARDGFLEYWRADGQAHFRQEEEVLLPALARHADPDQPVVRQVLVDHIRIRRLAEDAESDPTLDTLHALGSELERHVRREERELFPLIEGTMPEPELVALAARLGHGPSGPR